MRAAEAALRLGTRTFSVEVPPPSDDRVPPACSSSHSYRYEAPAASVPPSAAHPKARVWPAVPLAGPVIDKRGSVSAAKVDDTLSTDVVLEMLPAAFLAVKVNS